MSKTVKAVETYDDLLMAFALQWTGHVHRDNKIETQLFNSLAPEQASPVIDGKLDRNTNKWHCFVTADGWMFISLRWENDHPIYSRIDYIADKSMTPGECKKAALQHAISILKGGKNRSKTKYDHPET